MPHAVGVIGGGQLARMMIGPAIELGIELRVLEESAGSSASLAATAVGDHRDADAVLAFAQDVDVITFDHEHVPQHVLQRLVDAGVEVHPGPAALAVAQDKLLMRRRLSELGLPVPDWAPVASADELDDFLASHGGRCVVKTARGGYDGHGVKVVAHSGEVADWFTALAEDDRVRDARGGALLAEAYVPFVRELAQLVARRPSGDVVAWPVVETVQRDGICVEVFAPASASPATGAAAELATRIATELGVTGVLAVELFETSEGGLLINELAMRPHNSGHWSIEGSVTSQFEQHLRAVLDLPLGATDARAPHTAMINVLGGPAGLGLPDRYDTALAADPGVKVHAYGKQSRPGRKVGHVTAWGSDLADVVERARATAVRLT